MAARQPTVEPNLWHPRQNSEDLKQPADASDARTRPEYRVGRAESTSIDGDEATPRIVQIETDVSQHRPASPCLHAANPERAFAIEASDETRPRSAKNGGTVHEGHGPVVIE
ncbi:MAG: hypothetical protein AAFR84_08940 [Pseudomonadota bacterium]